MVKGGLWCCQVLSVTFCSALNLSMTSGQPRRLESSVKIQDTQRDTAFASWGIRDLQAWKVMRGDGWRYPGMSSHWGPSRCGWLHVLEGVANSSAQKKGWCRCCVCLKAACSVCKVVISRAWLVSKGRAWHLYWGSLRSAYCEVKWDGIPKEPRHWTICAQQVLASELCAVHLLCYFCCVLKLRRGCGKAARRSFYLCDIKCHVQTRGVWMLNYKGVICCCLSCVAERTLFVETELLSSKAIKCFHLFKRQPTLANELCCIFVCLFAVILMLVVFPQFIFKWGQVLRTLCQHRAEQTMQHDEKIKKDFIGKLHKCP